MDECDEIHEIKEEFQLENNDNSSTKSQRIRRMEPEIKEEEDKIPELQTQDTVRGGIISLL